MPQPPLPTVGTDPATQIRRGAGRRHEDALFCALAGGDRRAREELVARFMPLARSIALRYRTPAEPFEDVLQVAAIGLLGAIDRYDPARGIAFSSFAVPTIAGEIKRHFRDRTWAMRVPRALKELSLRVDDAVRQLTNTLGHAPTVAQIADAVGACDEDVLEALQAFRACRTISLDAPMGASPNDGVLAERVGVSDLGFDGAEQRAVLSSLLAMLPAREREILHLRFEQDMTQAQIGAVIGVSQMQVSRIIRAALARLHCLTDHPTQHATTRSSAQAADSPLAAIAA